MGVQNFTVTGMTCEHCEAAIRQEVQEIEGVSSVDVSRVDGHLAVEGSEQVTEQAIVDAVAEAGYQATPASGSAQD